MFIVDAILLALIQGSTEFLPISSSAHLVLFSEIRGYDAYLLEIAVVLHIATLLAVISYFRKDLYLLIVGCVRGDTVQRSYMSALVLGTIPVVLVGPFLYGTVESVSGVIPVIAVVLILSGTFLFIADWGVRSGRFCLFPKADTAEGSGSLLCRGGFVVGLFQILALFPGVSRSGITIAAGRLVGFSRSDSLRFSFLLSIPVIAGASVLVFLSILSQPPVVSSAVLVVWFLAGSVAFFAAYATIHTFIRLLDRIGFVPFFLYQVFLGLALLVFF